MNAKIITIAAQKGGVAKTTSAITISSYLAHKGYKVLLVDIDAQRNSTLVTLEGYETLKEDQTVAVLLKDGTDELKKAIHRGKIDNLWVLPSHSRLSEADVVLSQLMARESRLKMLLEAVKDDFDFIFIDAPPNVNWIPINAFVAADYVLIPVSPNAFDLEGIRLTMNTMKSVQRYHNQELKLLGLLMTFFDHRNSISHETYELLKGQFKEKMFNTRIPINTALQKANAHRQDIFTYEPTSTGAGAYKAFVEKEFLPKLNINLDNNGN